MNDRYQELLQRVRWGKCSKKELARIAEELVHAPPDSDRYILLHILGESKQKTFRPLIEQFLNCDDDIALVKMALQTLCVTWGDAILYTDQLLRFLRGVDWDVLRGGHVILMAISIAGEFLRESKHPALLAELIDIYEKEDDLFQDAAYIALGRTLGHSWSKLLMKMIKPEKIISDAHQRLAKEMA
jgi:hypothetical protein